MAKEKEKKNCSQKIVAITKYFVRVGVRMKTGTRFCFFSMCDAPWRKTNHEISKFENNVDCIHSLADGRGGGVPKDKMCVLTKK